MRIDTNNTTGAAYIMQAYAAQNSQSAGPIAKIQPSRAEQASQSTSQQFPQPAQRLVGAVVPGRVDFSAGEARQVSDGANLAMYRHPADRNAAATGVSIGRRLDVQG